MAVVVARVVHARKVVLVLAAQLGGRLLVRSRALRLKRVLVLVTIDDIPMPAAQDRVEPDGTLLLLTLGAAGVDSTRQLVHAAGSELTLRSACWQLDGSALLCGRTDGSLVRVTCGEPSRWCSCVIAAHALRSSYVRRHSSPPTRFASAGED